VADPFFDLRWPGLFVRHYCIRGWMITKLANKALQVTPNDAVSSAVADGAFWLGVPELSR
jgi:hypothetical protein